MTWQIRLSSLILLPACLFAGYEASVAGKVLDDRKKSVAGADVLITRLGLPPADHPQLSLRATSDKDGMFEFKGLLEGSYLLCARLNDSTFVDSCAWPSTTPLVVGNKQTIKDYAVILETGKQLIADVADAGEVLETRGNLTSAATFMFGVWALNGEWHPARISSRSPKARQYLLVVPYDKPLNIKAYAHKLNVEDESGKKIKREDPPIRFQEPKTSASTNSPKRFRFTVRNYEP